MLTFAAAVVEEIAEKSEAGASWYVEPLNALVAALIGTVVTLAVNAWWRHRNRAQPDWHLDLRGVGFKRGGSAHGHGEGYHIHGSLSNVGDGVAHGVKLRGVSKAHFGFRENGGSGGIAPLMLPGSTEPISGSIELGNWDGAVLVIEWTAPPTHRKKREELKIRIAEQLDRPGYEFTDPDTGVVSQKYFEDS